MSNERWLGKLQGDPRLRELVLPGSHDAGVYGNYVFTVNSPKSWARCQGSNIYNQAMHGSRMFDCRVFLKRNAETKKLVPTMGHFFQEKAKNKKGETGSGGAYGGTLRTAVLDAIDFVRKHSTEFLILRFSHTYCPTEVGAALSELMKEGSNMNYICTSSRNIARRRIADLRGKVIMVFASEFHTGFNHNNGYLPFYKYEPGVPTDAGICTCGIYKGSSEMKSVHKTAEKSFKEHKEHFRDPSDHLHFVYWQQTLKPGNIQEKTLSPNTKTLIGKKEQAYTGGAHANLGTFLDEIKTNVAKGDWLLPNIISHDFVTEQTCSQIIALNPLYVP